MTTRTLLLLLLLVACRGAEYPVGPAAEQPYVVHGMLRAGQSSHSILVERARAVDEGIFVGLTPVSGATVTIEQEGGTITPLGETTESGVYAASFPVVSGARYLLRVVAADGQVITGQTRVPAAPTILEPSQDTTLRWFDQFDLTWTRSPVAGGYTVVDVPDGTAENPDRVFYRATLPDTTWQHGFTGFGPQVLDVRIAAVDTNYADYRRPRFGEDADRRRVRTTVSGGYGLFGSYSLSAPRRITGVAP